jgi:hypothetical protein
LTAVAAVVFPDRQIKAFLAGQTIIYFGIIRPLAALQFGVFHLKGRKNNIHFLDYK